MSESVEDYKRWVDEMVNRPESLRLAREHAHSKTLKRNLSKDEAMRKTHMWAGTLKGLDEAVVAAGVSPDDVAVGHLISHIAVSKAAITKWCGIEEPPGDKFIMSAPIEGDGTARWVEYQGGTWAPEVDVHVLKFEADLGE